MSEDSTKPQKVPPYFLNSEVTAAAVEKPSCGPLATAVSQAAISLFPLHTWIMDDARSRALRLDIN